jgi:hypothetical protein
MDYGESPPVGVSHFSGHGVDAARQSTELNHEASRCVLCVECQLAAAIELIRLRDDNEKAVVRAGCDVEANAEIGGSE